MLEKDSLMMKASRLFDLPGDALGGMLRVELMGNREVFVGNHRGILELSENEVVLNYGKNDKLHILGDNLTVSAMTTEEIRLSGIIGSVSFGD